MNVRVEKFGLRCQSVAATPLFARFGRIQKRRGAALPAALPNAFTLVELLLVLTLLVVITSLVVPAMSNFIRARAVDSETRRLFALMHAGQSRAVSEGLPMMLWVDEKQGAYGLTAETPPSGGDPKAENLTVDENVQIAVLNVGATALTTFQNLPAIRFLADGTIDENSPQTLRLADAKGNALWLIEANSHMGYEIRDTDK
jgi:type II secretion system protein H